MEFVSVATPDILCQMEIVLFLPWLSLVMETLTALKYQVKLVQNVLLDISRTSKVNAPNLTLSVDLTTR